MPAPKRLRQLPNPNRNAYVSHLSRMTQRELSDHCTAILMRHIAESQARQIAILARHGIHRSAA